MQIANTGFMIVIAAFGWAMRTAWTAQRQQSVIVAGKLDELLRLHNSTKLEVAQLRGEVKSHDLLDDQKFRDLTGWVGRIEKHIEATDSRISMLHKVAP